MSGKSRLGRNPLKEAHPPASAKRSAIEPAARTPTAAVRRRKASRRSRPGSSRTRALIAALRTLLRQLLQLLREWLPTPLARAAWAH
jgi:hypothetical protein